MEKTFRVLNELVEVGVIKNYAIGGAFALLFYTEPTLTYDVDVFVFLAEQSVADIINLAPLYRYLEAKGYRAEKEHVMIGGVPVQFIPAYNPLVEEGVDNAVTKQYKGVETKAMQLEYLLAIMIATNRPKDRARIAQVLDEATVDRKTLDHILGQHGLQGKWEKYFGSITD